MGGDFDNKELYLYGTLMALAEEQSEAISRLTTGQLGWLGKSRIQSRGREIGKFLLKILHHKGDKVPNPGRQILEDIAQIKTRGLTGKFYHDSAFRTLSAYTDELL